jgi:hypothetical protein
MSRESPVLHVPVIPSTMLCEDTGQALDFIGPLTIGRHPHSDVMLDHARVSSRHAAIEWGGVGWVLRDLGSRNGTTVNHRKLLAARSLKEGDVIRFAGVSRWKVIRLGIPDQAVVVASTETVAGGSRAVEFDLHLSFTGADEGTIRIVRPDGEVAFEGQQQRFVLLFLLAGARGGWVPDNELKTGLWGRPGLYDMDVSALHKLIHDVRTLFRQQHIGGWVIEKNRGRTRLALDPERVHLDGPQ